MARAFLTLLWNLDRYTIVCGYNSSSSCCDGYNPKTQNYNTWLNSKKNVGYDLPLIEKVANEDLKMIRSKYNAGGWTFITLVWSPFLPMVLFIDMLPLVISTLHFDKQAMMKINSYGLDQVLSVYNLKNKEKLDHTQTRRMLLHPD